MKKDIDVVLKEAKAKIAGLVASAADPKDAEFILSTAENNKNFVFATLGFHPERARKYNQKQIDEYLEFIKNNKELIVAVGECGLDYNWNKTRDEQSLTKEIFMQFIELSNEIEKPIVVHARNGADNVYGDIFKLLEAKSGTVVMHCFSGSDSNLKEALSKKYWISYATNIARSDKHKRLAKNTPLEAMLLETDAPWLDPFGPGLTNRPWNIIYSAGLIANILEKSKISPQSQETSFPKIQKTTKENVLKVTTENASKAFSL
jgi:TatD DNase family protein